jgi:hypothetical protein
MRNILALVSLVFLLGTDTRTDIVGNWIMDGKDHLTVSFFSDGTFQDVYGDKQDTGPYTISDDGSSLQAKFRGTTYTGKITWIDHDTVQNTIRTWFGPRTFTFHRVVENVVSTNH